MEPFRRLTAIACPLPLANVDTDQLLPARFMTRPRSEGYGSVLLYDLRFAPDGAPTADFPLNDPARAGAKILVARRNFGGGSSREGAVYALVDHGFRCVIAPSFGDIFSGNAANNGLVAAQVTEAETEALLAALGGGLATLTVDLEALTIAASALAMGFAIDPVRRLKLLNGWDDLDLTASYADAIADFTARDAVSRPWTALPR